MKESPRIKAGPFSKLFFCWMHKLLWTGSSKELELDDIYRVLPEDESTVLGDKLEEAWKAELHDSSYQYRKWDEDDRERLLVNGKKRPRFGRAIYRVFGFEYGLLGIVAIFDECVIKTIQPVILGYLIRYFGGEFSLSDGYWFASGVIFCSAWYITQHHPYFFGLQHVGMRSRVAVSSLVYRKALRLSATALRSTTIGQMVNLLSNDINRFDQAPLMAWYLVVGPIQLGIVIYILWGYYSYVCLVGVGFLVLFVPFQSFMGSLFGKLRLQVAGKTDKRIRIMHEIVSAIRVIKMYTWEEPFGELVKEART